MLGRLTIELLKLLVHVTTCNGPTERTIHICALVDSLWVVFM